MCVGIGYLIFLFPLIAIISAFIGWKYGSRVVGHEPEDAQS